jgi:hypothetical protein
VLEEAAEELPARAWAPPRGTAYESAGAL